LNSIEHSKLCKDLDFILINSGSPQIVVKQNFTHVTPPESEVLFVSHLTNNNQVYIATDDERIIEVAHEYSLSVVMTSDKHETGIDRVAEVAGQLQEGYYVNIQGDEPFIKPEAIKLVARAIIDCDNPVVLATNANTPIQEVSENSPANVEKVEGVEMYRLIEHGYSIQMVKTNDSSILVDTPSDLKHVQEKFVSF